MSAPIERLAILLWSTSPERPDLAAAPFVYAAVAAAMDCDVEIHFAGAAVKLLLPGVAADRLTSPDGGKTLYAFMQEASEHGVRFLGCSMAMASQLAGRTDRIPEFSGTAGASAFISRTLDPDWRTLVF